MVQALSNALTTQRLHHAYLFTGTRGVGKSTVSRILAKWLKTRGLKSRAVALQHLVVCVRCVPTLIPATPSSIRPPTSPKPFGASDDSFLCLLAPANFFLSQPSELNVSNGKKCSLGPQRNVHLYIALRCCRPIPALTSPTHSLFWRVESSQLPPNARHSSG